MGESWEIFIFEIDNNRMMVLFLIVLVIENVFKYGVFVEGLDLIMIWLYVNDGYLMVEIFNWKMNLDLVGLIELNCNGF